MPASEANFELKSTIFEIISTGSSGNWAKAINFRSASDKASMNTCERRVGIWNSSRVLHDEIIEKKSKN